MGSSPRRYGWAWRVPALAAAAAALAAAPAAAPGTARASHPVPALVLSGDAGTLGAIDDLTLEASALDAAGSPVRIRITLPGHLLGWALDATGAQLGVAGLGLRPARGGPLADYSGPIVLTRARTLAAGAGSCAPGRQRAVWQLSLNNLRAGTLSVPVAVDTRSAPATLTICLGALRHQVAYVFLQLFDVYRNPAAPGRYLFAADVSGGAGGDAGRYELRAYDWLPAQVGLVARLDPTARVLLASGRVLGAGRARPGVLVHLYGGTSASTDSWTPLGTARTGRDGSFTISRPVGRFAYRYVYAAADRSLTRGCAAGSVSCRSTSVAGATSVDEPVLATLSLLEPRAASAALRDALLPASSVAALPDSPRPQLRPRSLAGAGIALVRHQQTACGEPLRRAPPLGQGAVELLEGAGGTVLLQWVARLGRPAAGSIFAAEAGGARPGCAAYATSTWSGAPARERLLALVPVPAGALDRRLATVSLLHAGPERAYVAKVFVQAGPVLAEDELLAPARPRDSFLAALALAAAARVDGLAGPS